jgi:hypothetical protein
MFGRKLGLVAFAALALGLVLAAPAAQARKKVVTKTYEVGVGAAGGGFAIPINDGAGQAAQLARSPIVVRGLNPRAAGSVRGLLRPDGDSQSAQRTGRQEGHERELVPARRGRRQHAPGRDARVLVHDRYDD